MGKWTYDKLGAAIDRLPFPDNEAERLAYCEALQEVFEAAGWTWEEWDIELERRIDQRSAVKNLTIAG